MDGRVKREKLGTEGSCEIEERYRNIERKKEGQKGMGINLVTA